jgi:phosphomannomutase
VAELSAIDALMARLRDKPPGQLRGEMVHVQDLAPDADVVVLRSATGRVVVRPSGTEPKLKAYLEIVEPVGDTGVPAARARAGAAMAALRTEVAAALGL